MAGWRDYSEADLAKIGKGNSAPVKPSKRAKYGNVRVVVDGITFDSKREAQHYHDLKLREKAKEIRNLRCQVPFDLRCPGQYDCDSSLVVAVYVADFTFWEYRRDQLVVVDVKGHRTALYQLKKKWLFLQDGIEIEEV